MATEKESCLGDLDITTDTPQSSSKTSLPAEAEPENARSTPSNPEDVLSDGTASIDSPPNGGLIAWCQVVALFFIFFNSWGATNSFGAYQTYYAEHLLSSSSESTIAWIGSVQTFLLFAVGMVAGRWFDAGYGKTLVVLGSILMVLGFVMTSFATAYWHVLLAQGICAGLGTGFLSLPSVAIVTTWFSTKQGLALGIGSLGASFGGVAFSFLFRKLIPLIGFPWAVRVTAIIMSVWASIYIALIRQRHASGPKEASVADIAPPACKEQGVLAAFKDPAYTFFACGQAVAFLGLWMPYFFIGGFALKHGASEDTATYLLGIMGGVSVIARIANPIADYTGPLNMFIPVTFLFGVNTVAWIWMTSNAAMYTFAIVCGILGGASVSLPPVCIASLTDDMSTIGMRIGIANGLAAVANLCGPPIAGAIISIQGDYWGGQLFAGVTVLLGAALMAGARIHKTGWKFLKGA